jgi:hypothetical protein
VNDNDMFEKIMVNITYDRGNVDLDYIENDMKENI